MEDLPFAPPKDVGNPHEFDMAWDNLILEAGCWLRTAIGARTPIDWQQKRHELDEWNERVFELRDDPRLYRYRHRMLRRWLWCAQHVAEAPSDGGILAQIDLAKDKLPAELQGHRPWAIDCCRWLRGDDRVEADLQLHAAVYSPLTQSEGAAWLVLELRSPGAGQVFHHPADALATFPEPDFYQAIATAWHVAWNRNEGTGRRGVNGRWRLVDREHQPEPWVHGPSAGGAATYGWHHLLQDWVIEGVAVLATIDEQGRPAGVGHVRDKVQAIQDEPGLDTIVVADPDDAATARATLREVGLDDKIRVKLLE